MEPKAFTLCFGLNGDVLAGVVASYHLDYNVFFIAEAFN